MTTRADLFNILLTAMVISLPVAASSQQYISTVAGSGSCCFSGDGGPATQAQFFGIMGVTFDRQGNMYITDQNAQRIRKVDVNGIVTTIAGNTVMPGGTGGYNGDNKPATEASLNSPQRSAVDAAGNVYVADKFNSRIRKIDVNGYITTVAGNGYTGKDGDNGQATSARLYWPTDVDVDLAGNIYIADSYNHRIRKVSATGIITTIAGTSASNNDPGFSGDGSAAINARLNYPVGITLDSSGNIFFTDSYNHRVRKIDVNGIITTIAGTGNGSYGGDNGAATLARLQYPQGIDVDSAGNIYVVDFQNNRIRKIDTNGIITTVAGYGAFGSNPPDYIPALQASLSVNDLFVGSNGTFFITDADKIRKIAYLDSTQLCSGTTKVLTADVSMSSYRWQRDTGTGVFHNLSDNANFSGTFTASLQLNNPSAASYGHKYRATNGSFVYGKIYRVTFGNRWTGTVNSDWSNPSNWSCGTLPDSKTDVVINSGSTVTVNANVTVRSLTLSPGASFTVMPGYTITVLNP